MDNLVKSIPFVGAKHKLLPQLLPHLNKPQFTRTLDVMCGSGVVGVNLDCNNIILNDSNTQLMGILRTLYEYPPEVSIEVIEGIIKDNQLDAQNKLAYNFLRKAYNDTYNDPYILLTLLYHSFNGMMRFNKKNHYNCPFGLRTFNTEAKTNLYDFIIKLRSKTVAFRNLSIGLWDFTGYGDDVLVYYDPPYLQSGAAYNAGWKQEQDNLLMAMLDKLNDQKTSFAMSNAFSNNGKQNTEMMTWAKKYDVVYLDADYSNSYYTRKKAKTVEVLIKNYE